MASSNSSLLEKSEHCLEENCFWISSTNLKINDILIGDGITEVFNFSNSTENLFRMKSTILKFEKYLGLIILLPLLEHLYKNLALV